MANRYLLTYTPTNQRVDGGWRAVSLVTADPELKVRVKPGYFAPKPPPVRPTIEFTVTGLDRADDDVTRDDLTLVEDGVAQSDRHLPRGDGAGVDRPGARRERQHAAGGGCGEGRGALASSAPCGTATSWR